MAPIIPSSLSPHIAILTSPDLEDLLKSASLPSLPHILQSFSPLPQVTTRTTALVSVPHASFALRFSDIHEVEEACQEDDDRRAERTIDWMTARINHRCAKWVQDWEKVGDRDAVRTPWWDELRRCAEGDFVPSKTEGWNHPAAVILAVSTSSPNPLQAITALHTRNNHFPPWVDTNFLRYTLIIHSENSPLSDEEAAALYNAVKKQFGLHSYLLSLSLPKSPPTPVPVPALMPRLPPPPTPESTPSKPPPTPNVPAGPSNPTALNTLAMAEKDIQTTARFTREFVVMSLVPWMEKCVLEWNENFSSTRRLPSRLFSSTRRLFGSPSASPAPLPPAAAPTRSSTLPSTNGGPVPPSQQRRLAEFATILGDFKLAVTVWETLRKEGKGGSDVLPLLLSPTPVMKQHAHAALLTIHPAMMDLPPHSQMRALLHAVRWEAGVATRDFISNEVEGERWLVWAASNAEEAPSALLLAQAALLSTKKQAWRRAALWYTIAATRLEKCGIKPLTMYFLRKAQELYNVRPTKELSPSFWDSEGKSATNSEGLEDIFSGIEHPLGRLLYTTGDVSGAVKLFLTLLRGSSAFSSIATLSLGEGTPKVPGNDKLYLDDFRVAFSYWKSTEPDQAASTHLESPVKLCVGKHSRPRYSGDSLNDDADLWASRQESWQAFWKTQGGKEGITPAAKISTDELFWVDLVLHNQLDADVSLSNLTLVVQETGETDAASGTADFVEVETISEVLLRPKESTTVPISVKSTRPSKLSITHAKYDFLSLLPTKESLACRGRRLHDTPLQRQTPTYAPDVVIQVEVVPSYHRLNVSFIDDERLVLLQGENRVTRLWLTNAGSKPISEVWMVAGAEDEIWVGAEDALLESTSEHEVMRSSNRLQGSRPRRLPLIGADKSSVLQPGDSTEVSVILHTESPGIHELSVLFVFRESEAQPFYSTRLSRSYEVETLFEISVNANPAQSTDYAYAIDFDMTNISSTASVNITDIACLSPQWKCHALFERISDAISPSQCSRFLLGATHWSEGKGTRETQDFVVHKFDKFLKGGEHPDTSLPPPIDLLCSHVSKTPRKLSIQGPAIMDFIQSARQRYSARQIAQHHPSIPPHLHSSIFPLYNPAAVDFVIFWENPSQSRSGHVNVHGITLGAGHAALDGIIEEAESAKVKRSMYAETRRENLEVMEAIRDSEWNVEMDPIVLTLKDVGTKQHDFSTGPCHIPVAFSLRNHSLTLPARYTLKLQSKPLPSTSSFLPPSFTGRLTFRGSIPSSGTAIVQAKLWVTKPGTYSLGGWTLETEVSIEVAGGGSQTRKRRYLQEAQLDDGASLIVCDFRTS